MTLEEENQALRAELARVRRVCEEQRRTLALVHERLARVQAAKRAKDQLLERLRAGSAA